MTKCKNPLCREDIPEDEYQEGNGFCFKHAKLTLTKSKKREGNE